MQKENIKKISIVTLFAIAMGFLESCIVIYLRKIYYLNGFDFPLKGFIEPQILNIEWIREFFTIIMLLCIGYLAGKKFYDRFAYFLYAFAIWDLFYYIFLKVCLNWPSSFFTWDLLFLIPWPWISPVLAPIIYSIDIIILAFLIIDISDKKRIKVNILEIALFISGSAFILYSFIIDYGKLIILGGYLQDFLTLATNQEFTDKISSFIPSYYNWPVFIFGEILILASIVLLYFRNKK